MSTLVQRRTGIIYKDNAEDKREMNLNRDRIMKYNQTPCSQPALRDKLIREILGDAGKNLLIHSPFFCDCGYNIHAGDNVFMNYNVCILDCGEVFIGDNVLIAPNVAIYTIEHMLDPKQRKEKWLQTARVTIGNNVWLGGNTVILAGVTIGDDTVIGAGSVVTKDIPAGVLAFGNSCRVIRKLSLKDKKQIK